MLASYIFTKTSLVTFSHALCRFHKYCVNSFLGSKGLKYTNCGVSTSLEKKLVFSRKNWISILILDKHSSTKQTRGTKTNKKRCPKHILEGVVDWLLASNVKNPTYKLLPSTKQIARILCQLKDSCNEKHP